MKIGLAQMNIIWEAKEENKKNCSRLIDQAKTASIDLLLFPELTLTGFSMNTSLIAENKKHSDTVTFFQQQAEKNQLAIGFGVCFQEASKAGNHFLIAGENGDILADYKKIHPFSFGEESKYYLPGNELAFCYVKEVPLSPLICYDLRFPEIFQACSHKSRLIAVIANWPVPRQEHWYTLLKARAIENQCYIAGVNRTGEGGGLTFFGGSVVFDPYGTEISLSEPGSELITAQIDPSVADHYRTSFRLKQDRKEFLYTQFYQNK